VVSDQKARREPGLFLVRFESIMPDTSELARYYESLTDGELLILNSEGGFTEDAAHVLGQELKRRNLAAGDLTKYLVPARIRLREEAQEKGFRARGPGLLFFGRRYLNESDRKANIQVRTKWFALGGMPIIPIASYRFKCSGEQGKSALRDWLSNDPEQRVIQRVPLNWNQVFLTWMKTAIFVLVVFLLAYGFAWYCDHARR